MGTSPHPVLGRDAELESIDVDWPPKPQLLVGRTGGAYSPVVGPQHVIDGSGTPYLLGLQSDITDGGGVIGTALVRLPRSLTQR